jgi:dTMP kinase
VRRSSENVEAERAGATSHRATTAPAVDRKRIAKLAIARSNVCRYHALLMKRNDSGLLIAFEGIDGAGKTTQVGLLESFLKLAGETVVCSKEPTNGPWGKIIRESATSQRLPLSDELRHFIEDRKEHVRDLIGPALQAGKAVILDRYFYSTIAYQGARGNHVDDLTRQMDEIAPLPDATIILDVPPEIGLYRISSGRGETPNKFENLVDLGKARTIFQHLAETREEASLIDGTPNQHVTFAAVLKAILDGPLYRRHCAKHWGCDDPFNCAYRMTNTCRWAKMKRQSAVLV